MIVEIHRKFTLNYNVSSYIIFKKHKTPLLFNGLANICSTLENKSRINCCFHAGGGEFSRKDVADDLREKKEERKNEKKENKMIKQKNILPS
jgi:hypothetical protein